MLRMISAVLLFCSTAGVIGSPNAYNVTESSHTEADITTIPRDVENKTMYEDYVSLKDWFVAPHLLTVLLAASDKIHSSRCKTQSRLYLKELRNFTMWAAQMFDSAAKIPVGVLAGNQYHLGHYDECVEISLDAGETFGGMLEGQYCLAEIQFDTAISLEADPYTLNYDPKSSAFEKIKYKHDPSKVRRDVMHWALCTPASCSPEELNEVLKQELTKVGKSHGIQFKSHISHELCHTLDHTQTLSAGDIGYLFVLISLISLLVSSTLYDYKFTTDLPENNLEPTTKNPSKMEKIFLCFSARRSVKNLFTRNSIHPALETTHGARVFFMLMIIMEHRIVTYGGHPLFNAEAEERLFRSIPSMLLGNGTVIVDGFFTLSGLLMSYSLVESQSKSKRISLAKQVLVRFFRLTPSYMMLVFFHATLLHHMGSGPFWDVTVGREQRRCATNWWSNLLYINNYINVREMCMFQSWYLAVDFQLYIVSLLAVSIIARWPRLGYAALGLLTTTSVVVSSVLIYQNQAEALLFPYPDNMRDVRDSSYFQTIYVGTQHRVTPYFVGVISGVVLYKLRSCSHRLGKVLSHVAYISCAWGLGTAILLSAYVFFIPGRPYSALEAALYGPLHRIGFALAVSSSYIIVSCGQIEIYQRFFSSKPFVVLSRLTYGAYLTHTVGQLYDQGTLRVPRYLSVYTGIWLSLGDIVIAFGLSFFLLLLVETPFRCLQKLIIK